MSVAHEPAVWFPTVRAGTGTDVFTMRLAEGLTKRGIRSEITWLPLRAEYAPWTVPVPQPPEWATVAHVNTWLHSRFLPRHLPVVATLHHSVHHPDARAYKSAAQAAYHRYWIAPNERRVLRRADHVVAVSHFVAETARQTLLDVPMQVIYNGVDTERFCPGNRHRQPGEPFRLLYVGSWIPRKGVDLLAPIMRELGDGFELRYTGGPPAARDEPGRPPNMHDIGHLDGDAAVAAAMHDADALLFPSRSEGFGLVAVEAMACGLPVVASRVSTLTEVVGGQGGILCTVNDTNELVAGVRRVAGQLGEVRSMSKLARQRATSHFDEKIVLDRHVSVYRMIGT